MPYIACFACAAYALFVTIRLGEQIHIARRLVRRQDILASRVAVLEEHARGYPYSRLMRHEDGDGVLTN